MAAKVNINIEQGAALDKVIFRMRTTTGANVDISLYTDGMASFKVNYRSSAAFQISNVSFGSDGSIRLTANSEFTGGMPAGRYVYDVAALNENGHVTRLVEGYCSVDPMVSVI